MNHVSKAHLFVYICACFAAIGGFLFGYDTGVIAGAILFIRKEFTLGPGAEELIIGIISIGAVLGALASGPLSDRFGRKKIVLASALLFIASSIQLALSYDVTSLVIGRTIVGFAIGIASTTVPIYIAELAPREHRGTLVTTMQLAITIGILAAFCAGALFASHENWRMMFLVGAIPAAIQFIGMLFLPESPRWLIKSKQLKLANTVLLSVRDRSSDVKKEIDHIKKNIKAEHSTWRELLEPAARRALLIGVGVTVIQQITGINCVLYYAPTIFQYSGFSSTTTAMLATTGVGLINVFMTFIAIWLLDRSGRRPLLLVGLGGMIFSLFLLGLGFLLPDEFGASVGLLTAFSLMLFVGFFAFSLGPVGWLLNSEIYPLKLRGRAMSLAVFSNWLANFIVTTSFLSLVKTLGSTYTFWLYGLIGVIGWLFIYMKVPETKGKSLEEIQDFWHRKRRK